MIGYVFLGTNDLARACAYYDELLGEMGATRMFELENAVLWGTDPKTPKLGVITPHDGKPATIGNGSMTAVFVGSNEKVDEMYAKALELGGTDEGPPGVRLPPFYGGYFRDLDGNKLVFAHITMS